MKTKLTLFCFKQSPLLKSSGRQIIFTVVSSGYNQANVRHPVVQHKRRIGAQHKNERHKSAV